MSFNFKSTHGVDFVCHLSSNFQWHEVSNAQGHVKYAHEHYASVDRGYVFRDLNDYRLIQVIFQK